MTDTTTARLVVGSDGRLRREDWQRSTDGDMLWSARKTVLDLISWMDGTLDVLDPIGCRRYNEDRDGNPLHEDEGMGTCELIFEWQRKLHRVNGILRELEQRREVAHGADSAAVPD